MSERSFRTGELLVMLCLATPGAFAAPGPFGVYLWYPGPGVPTDADCRDLVAEVKPSIAKAEDWLWGRVPNFETDELELYLIVTPTRIETTYSAEGDYDRGSVTWTDSEGGAYRFTLVPDEHPETKIAGTIVSPPSTQVTTLTLNGIPADRGTVVERMTYYCRFPASGPAI
ncbi:hypothetical protein [Nitratireductor alexandrii]|uniref:hypothetical protein n=1 Tax=Nitratireductor alexandrii TaxID=2448161 RepID=UPI000FD9109E|nr:hypothetical protein [Nitratireductor alexandrii]